MLILTAIFYFTWFWSSFAQAKRTNYIENEDILINTSALSPLRNSYSRRSHSDLTPRSKISLPLLSNHLDIKLSGEVPPVKRNKVVLTSIADFIVPKVHKRLTNISNFFVTADSESLVYFDRELKNWILQKFHKTSNSMTPIAGMRIPLSRCLSTAFGGPGYVSTQLDVSVYAEYTFSSPTELKLLAKQNEVIASLSHGFHLGTAAGFTGLVVCNAAPGQYVQPYLYPYFFEVPRGKRCKARYVEGKGLEPVGEWEDTPSYLRIVANGLLECAIANSSSVCESIIPGLNVTLESRHFGAT